MSDASPWDSRNHSGRVTDASRIEVTSRLDPDERSRLGQFMTPTVVADFMATLFTHWPRHIVLLDPGAGIGSLTEAFAERFRQCAPAGGGPRGARLRDRSAAASKSEAGLSLHGSMLLLAAWTTQ